MVDVPLLFELLHLSLIVVFASARKAGLVRGKKNMVSTDITVEKEDKDIKNTTT